MFKSSKVSLHLCIESMENTNFFLQKKAKFIQHVFQFSFRMFFYSLTGDQTVQKQYLMSSQFLHSLPKRDFIKALRWPKIIGLLTFAIINNPSLSTVKKFSKIKRGFGTPKVLRNLLKIFPKIRSETPVRK